MTDPLDLVIDDGPAGTREQRLEPPGPHRIGRALDASVRVADHRASRTHAVLEVRDGLWWYHDESTGGSFTAGDRVTSLALDRPTTVRIAAPDGPTIRFGVADHATSDEPISIGRDRFNDVVLPELIVSRHHAVIMRTSTGWRIADRNSKSGTFVNGRKIAKADLYDGDTVTVGNTDLVFRDGHLVTATPQDAQLRIAELHYDLPNGTSLLHGIDLDLAPGTLLAVIGPSGAGKSTFAKVLTGAQPATSGKVEYGGFDLYRDFDLLRTRVGYVPQDDIVHRKLTARRALTYAAKLRMPTDASLQQLDGRVNEVLADLGLLEHARTLIDDLSGGQRKRVSIALELLTEPQLLILDEPTSGLDPGLDRQVMDLLRTTAETGRTVVVITHYPDGLTASDQVLLLAKGGRQEFFGLSSELLGSETTSLWPDVFARASVSADGQGTTAAPRSPVGRPNLSATPNERADEGGAGESWQWVRQVRTLAARHARLILADRPYAAFILALPVVLAVLAAVVPGGEGLGPPMPDATSEPAQLLVVLIVGAAFMGAAAAAREVIGERAILTRERAAGLQPHAYVAAKVLVFGAVCAVQAILLVAVTSLVKPMPDSGVLLPGGVEIVVAVGLTAYASCMLALWLSAVVRSAEQVMPLLVVSVMAQLVLCGGLIPVTDRAGLTVIATLAPARWGYAAAASTSDLRGLVPAGPRDALWTSGVGWWLLAVAALVSLSAAFAALGYRWVLRIDR